MRSRFTHGMQVAAAVAAAVAITAPGVAAQEVLVKDGEAVAFLGDSITEFGAARPSGSPAGR